MARERLFDGATESSRDDSPAASLHPIVAVDCEASLSNLLAYLNTLPLIARIAVFAALAVGTHLLVVLIRRVSAAAVRRRGPPRKSRKVRSMLSLCSSAVVFVLYFFSLGLILREFGVSLTAYLASASVVGLAIGFGSQGIVQDVVTGITFVFTDLIDVGDLVEISGQTGIVKAITMRFVELENALGANVFIPNRTISNVINYPRGYIRCLVDVTLPGDEAQRKGVENVATNQMKAAAEQYPGISIIAPSIEGQYSLSSGKSYLRIKFRIWPNRGEPIETNFVAELLARLKEIDPSYDEWMIAVTYEAEQQRAASPASVAWPWRKAAASEAGSSRK